MEANRFHDLLCAGKLSRREAHRILAAAGLSLIAVPLKPRAARAEEPMMFFTWGGYEEEAFQTDFIEKYGFAPDNSLFGDQDEALSKMRAGFTPDAMYPCGSVLENWYDTGLLDEIETDQLSHWPDVFDELKEIPHSVVDGKQVFVPLDWGVTSVIFRRDLAPEYIGEENHTWGILWDPKYEGKLGMFDSMRDAVPATALYLGYDFRDLNQEQIGEVRNALNEQRPLLRSYVGSTTDLIQMLTTGELVASIAWNSAVAQASDAGLDFEFMTPKEGIATWVCGFTINPAARENGKREQAHDLCNSYLSPEAGAYEIENWGYGVANRKAFDLVDDETLALYGLTDPKSYLARGVFMSTMKHEQELVNMYDEVKAGF